MQHALRSNKCQPECNGRTGRAWLQRCTTRHLRGRPERLRAFEARDVRRALVDYALAHIHSATTEPFSLASPQAANSRAAMCPMRGCQPCASLQAECGRIDRDCADPEILASSGRADGQGWGTSHKPTLLYSASSRAAIAETCRSRIQRERSGPARGGAPTATPRRFLGGQASGCGRACISLAWIIDSSPTCAKVPTTRAPQQNSHVSRCLGAMLRRFAPMLVRRGSGYCRGIASDRSRGLHPDDVRRSRH